METMRQVNRSTTRPIPQVCPSNDNRHKPVSMGRSIFPGDAVARIYKPCRAVTTSGRARANGWRLVFERRIAPFIEPLMGYTGARSRALARGAEPRLDAADYSVNELALHEIAAGAFTRDELAPFLPGADERRLLPPPFPASRLRDGGSVSAAAAPASRPRETVH